MSMEQEEKVCFICLDGSEDLEPGLLMRSPCNCTNRWAHRSCLIKMINFSRPMQRVNCPVCTTAYTGIQRREHTELNFRVLRKWCGPLFCLILALSTLIGCATYTMIHVIGGDQRIHVIIVVSVVIPVAILGVIIFGVSLLHVGPQIWVTRIECDLEMNALSSDPMRQEGDASGGRA